MQRELQAILNPNALPQSAAALSASREAAPLRRPPRAVPPCVPFLHDALRRAAASFLADALLPLLLVPVRSPKRAPIPGASARWRQVQGSSRRMSRETPRPQPKGAPL